MQQPQPQPHGGNMQQMYHQQNQINPGYNSSQQMPQQNYQQTGGYQSQQAGGSGPMFARNYKTVPCKYFHSPQGCVKSQGCTFIHDEKYAGQPTPSMLKSNRGMVMTSYNPNDGQMSQISPQMGNFYQPHPNDYQGRN